RSSTGVGQQVAERDTGLGGFPSTFTALGFTGLGFTGLGTSSFVEFLSGAAPGLLPGNRPLPPGSAADLAPHGTTVVAATFGGGVVMAGDRRATMGNLIAERDVQKVYPADDYSLIRI